MSNTAPAYTIGNITRPELFFDANGNILLEGAAVDFAAIYGLKLLYLGLPASTPWPPVTPPPLSAPVDTLSTPASVAEGAAANTAVNLTVQATSSSSNAVTYSLTADSSGGGFKIDPHTGVVTVADPTKVDYEAPGHAFSVTVQASDGISASSQAFSIAVTDVAPSAPTDANPGANTVAEGAAVNTLVGITAASTVSITDPAATYSLVGDSSGGGFKIDPHTGVVSVADPSKIDYENSGPGHSYTITVQASDGALTNVSSFTVAVTDPALQAPTDTNGAANSVAEGAAVNTLVGLTASAATPVNDPAATYSLTANFPRYEIYCLTSQMRRASISVPANIAEGFKKRGLSDKIRFLNVAQGSLEDCRYYLILVQDLGTVQQQRWRKSLRKFLNCSALT